MKLGGGDELSKVRDRVRTSADWDKPVGLTYLLCSPPCHVPNSQLELSAPLGGTKYHHLVDVYDGVRYANNPCFHEKYRLVEKDPPAVYDGSEAVVAFDNGRFQVLSLARALASSVISAAEIDDFSAKAEQSFIAPLPEGMSIVNQIIEIIGLLEFNIKSWKKMIKRWKDAVGSFFWKLRQLAESGKTGPGNMWVAWRFAIRPTIRDFNSLIHSLQNAVKALKWLQKVNHRLVRRHYFTIKNGAAVGQEAAEDFTFGKVHGEWGQIGPPPTYDIVPPMAGEPIHGELVLRITDSIVRLTACADVVFDIFDKAVNPNDWAAIGMAWNSMQWLYNPWAITWEAVPFSWAIDWCLSEKAKLERWKQFHETGDPYSLGSIKTACWSFKMKLWCELVYRPADGPEQLVASVLYDVYSRELGLPDMGSSWLRTPLDWYKLSISYGVLEGRLRRR